jgi:processive 1,2-diacylglycerol beta-glucosyltransferase
MNDASSYGKLRENFLGLRYEEEPTIVVRELVELAQEAAGTTLTPRAFPPPRRT